MVVLVAAEEMAAVGPTVVLTPPMEVLVAEVLEFMASPTVLVVAVEEDSQVVVVEMD